LGNVTRRYFLLNLFLKIIYIKDSENANIANPEFDKYDAVLDLTLHSVKWKLNKESKIILSYSDLKSYNNRTA
jgi:hypothetical protein